MLLFFSIILIIFILFFVILVSEIKFKINNFELLREKRNTNIKYSVKIGLYFLGKLPIFFFNLTNEKAPKFIKKSYIEKVIKDFQKIDRKKVKSNKKTLWNIIRKKGKITAFKLKMYIDTENILTTSYLVGIISSIIPNLLRQNIENANCRNLNYKIKPLYRNQNFIYLKLNSIFSIKLVHIINMLKVMGGNENERTSNRKLNTNCYGKY